MSGRGHKQREGTSPLEWAVAALGGALLALGIGYMLYNAVAHPSGIPRITVEVVSIEHDGTYHHVGFVARNAGQATAAEVAIRGELRQDGATVEESETVLDFLPQQSERRGTLLFSSDPAASELTVRPLGFREP